MQCPQCKEVALVMTDRQGVEIDYCPSCRGVWLDRGELDKLIERSIAQLAPASPPVASVQAVPQEPAYQQPYQQGRRPDFEDSDDSHKRQKQRSYGKYEQRKKKSWLSEIFD
jgi:hypothetical protein